MTSKASDQSLCKKLKTINSPTMSCSLKSMFFWTVGMGMILVTLQIWLTSIVDEQELRFEDVNVPVVLWWTPFMGEEGRIGTCGSVQCYFTQNRTFMSHSYLKGLLFYGTSIQIDDLPVPRQLDVDWGLLHEESPRNNPILVHQDVLSLFNHSATFSRYSDVPLTLVDLLSEEELVGTKYFVSFEEKTRLMEDEKLAPLLYIQSDCDTASARDSYITELMKYIPIDSYGSCLNNRLLPKRLKENHLDTLGTKDFLTFVAKYKFTLAFENAVCDDYITEKLWRPLVVGSVPVYYGSPSFKDWLPNNDSAISVRDFESPQELARFLLNISNDRLRYQRYLMHKLSVDTSQGITNHRLSNALRSRPKDVPNGFGNYVQAFQCLVCKRLHDKNRYSGKYIVTSNHYNCPLPTSPLSQKNNADNPWIQQWNLEKCSAKILTRHVFNNISININQFNEEKYRMYLDQDCL